MSLGGFQSGFHARKVPRSEAKWASFLICSHGCAKIIQLISHVSGEVEFELCRSRRSGWDGCCSRQRVPEKIVNKRWW
ncbi:hypothetical protein J2X83_003389 [Brevibacillus nitrificans]|nr:hypothetical protein [Brevibacillus nitrificans]